MISNGSSSNSSVFEAIVAGAHYKWFSLIKSVCPKQNSRNGVRVGRKRKKRNKEKTSEYKNKIIIIILENEFYNERYQQRKKKKALIKLYYVCTRRKRAYAAVCREWAEGGEEE